MWKLGGEDFHALEEELAPAFDTKQFWQLGQGDGQGRAGLEAQQDGLADEIDE
ncbi:hypothetical protein D3C71_1963770 [compost metagenome]